MHVLTCLQLLDPRLVILHALRCQRRMTSLCMQDIFDALDSFLRPADADSRADSSPDQGASFTLQSTPAMMHSISRTMAAQQNWSDVDMDNAAVDARRVAAQGAYQQGQALREHGAADAVVRAAATLACNASA